ncbi:MAG TPA: VOC family protein, partial [Gemmatimonadaceae bacterium]|nr:VOC family protein [Gemmatimonadaceae bacterium]
MANLDRLFTEFDAGRLTRRELLQALGFTVVAPAFLRAQGRGPQGDTTHVAPPFKPTGWKTVWLDHITYQCTDNQKAAAFYAAVMGWKVRSSDAQKIVMDIGPVGEIHMTNGYVPPPPPPAPPPSNDSTGRGRGGRGGGGRGTPATAAIVGLAWGIAPWNTNKVESELKKRGLDPVADHGANGYKSFHVKDPDGFDIQLSNATQSWAQKGEAMGKPAAPPPFEPTGWKTMWLDHISYGCSDYRRTVAFYEALLGWKAGRFTGSQSTVDIDDVGGAIIRNRAGGRTSIDHISFGIEGFDPDKVEAELMKRGLGRPAPG